MRRIGSAAGALACAGLVIVGAAAAPPAEKKPGNPPVEKAPKPTFSGAYFGKMPRAWVEILKADPERRVIEVRTKKGEVREVPIRADTEMRIRDAWGAIGDLFPGQSVMLFVYPDAEGKWVYPRAVQDEIQMMSGHKWWWTVDKLDPAAGTVDLSRTEKEKTFRESFRVGEKTKVWKGDKPGALDTLKTGDVVLFQTRYDAGQEKRFVLEFFDAEGLKFIKAEQLARHHARLAAEGLPAMVNDLDVLTGAVTVSVQWEATDLARAIKPGEKIELTRPGAGGAGAAGGSSAGVGPLKLSAPVCESRGDGVRHKLLLAAEPAAMIRLRIGDEVRVFRAAPGGEAK